MVVYMLKTIGKFDKGHAYDVSTKTAEKMIEKGWAIKAEDYAPQNQMMTPANVVKR